jgi:tRNA pseudouridine13 synthase
MAIKKQPLDFIVQEVPDPGWSRTITTTLGPCAVYELHKQSLSTPEAVAALARRLKVGGDSVEYAGLKDKHAATVQQVTVKVGYRRAAALPPDVGDRQWSARRVGYCPRHIDSKAIAGNRFIITVRTLTRRAIDELRDRAKALALDDACSRLLAVNYFGDQRFGSARSGQFVARLLIRGQFEQAMRHLIAVHHRKDTIHAKNFKRALDTHWGNWPAALAQLKASRVPEMRALRHLAGTPGDFRGAFAQLPYFQQQMTLESYQSLLWNRIARRFIEATYRPSAPLFVAEDKFGDMVFPAAAAVPPDAHAMDLPILGRDDALVEPWRDAAQSVLAEEGIATSELRIPGLHRPWFGSAPRTLFMVADDFAAAAPEVDELQPKARRFKLRLAFTLPRGSYATVMLRALGQ